MADIARCSGKECPLADRCYRHTATPGALQSYFIAPPIKPDGTCPYFWATAETNSRVDRMERRKDLSCSFCPPNRKENAGRRPKHGEKKKRRTK